MTTAALITKLKKKLDKESDANVLRAIEILLKTDTKEARMQRRMMEGAIRSEEDIAHGKTMSLDEAKRKLKASIAKRRELPGKAQRAKRA
jgi:hypothetical protein